ncbi:MAG: hypothetical protein ACRC62_04230 [Microcoleus sp.]
MPCPYKIYFVRSHVLLCVRAIELPSVANDDKLFSVDRPLPMTAGDRYCLLTNLNLC